MFGLGTMTMQFTFGALFGTWIKKIKKISMKSSSVLIRFARPVAVSILRRTGFKFEAMESKEVSSAKFYINSYRDVNLLISKLIKNKAFVLGIDYIEPLVERISKGGKL